ncbi:glycosyltransferase [Candidatus Saccharibacteria bacterium]|nr:glycosyltransferase [Candidatus Saccharibacteria bacterium]
MSENVDLTAVVTAHDEGLVAHKTMRSVFEALDRVKEAGYSFEIIIHIDNGSKETIKYFERYKNDKNIRVFENKFGDTGPSRNFAVGQARGKYVAFLDGDDLISDNWYVNGIKILEQTKEEIIVHPEALLTFGINQTNVLTLQGDSMSKEQDTLVLIGENRWSSTIIAKKETLEKIPYRRVGGGYGHEDYIFNIEAVEKGILHKIAKETMFFYRRSDDSRLSSGNREGVTIPAMELFDFDKVKQLEVEQDRKVDFKMRSYKIYKKIRGNRVLNYFITPVAKMTLKIMDREPKSIPDFVYDAWVKINHIESQLYPYDHVVQSVRHYAAEEHTEAGKVYLKAAESVKKLPDYVFIVPWIVRGGADKVLLNYIEALTEIHPEWHFTVITTLPVKNVWANKLPQNVDVIDFGNLSAGLVPDVRDEVMCRIITQLRCKRLHIINSEYGFEWARKHKTLLKAHYDLYVSLFCGEFIPGSNLKGVFSYDNPGLFEIIDVVKKCFTDNETIIGKTIERNAFDAEKFKVHYQPVRDLEMTTPKDELVELGKMHILWASRVTPTKLPELVAEIGKKLDPGKFVIDVYGGMSGDVSKTLFDGIDAIKYHGAFDGFKSLPAGKSDAFLYTALDDGVPNVILEATAAGLPVIASNDGGVGEFIKNEKTGILVEDYLNSEAYVETIKNLLKEPEVMQKYVKNAQKLLQEQHSWENFVEVVKNDID